MFDHCATHGQRLLRVPGNHVARLAGIGRDIDEPPITAGVRIDQFPAPVHPGGEPLAVVPAMREMHCELLRSVRAWCAAEIRAGVVAAVGGTFRRHHAVPT